MNKLVFLSIQPTYPQDNCAFNRIFDHLGDITNKDETYSHPVQDLVSLETLFPPDISEYYRYSGSLTTPGCHESVTWTVFKTPIQISFSQVIAYL